VRRDEMISEANGDVRWPRWHLLTRQARVPLVSPASPGRSGRQLAGLTVRQLRRAPGVPGSWSRFVAAHARWIVAVTIAVVGGALLLAHSQTPTYISKADVYVRFSAAEGGTLQAPDMATEKAIVSSGAVLAIAAKSLHVPQSQLLPGVSATVPASTYLLQIFYSDPSPQVARERAQAIASAYVSYRSSQSASAKKGAKAANPAQITPTADLVTSASLPTSPSSPNYLIDIGAALIVGLGLGIGSAALRDHLDDHLRGPGELEALAGAPVLGLIPSFWRSRRHPARRLAVVVSPDSVVAEAYRNLRTRLVHAAASRGARTLLVTSAAWEDKSTVAANLAASLAQAGYRTILVCADLRWGSAHEIFVLEDRGGLTRLLDRRTDLTTAVQATGIPLLRVLPPGPLLPDPSAALQRPALRTVVGELRSRADFVIIDAPALLATPDAGPLGDLTEMILPVADARWSTRAQVNAAVGEMRRAESEMRGAESKVIGWVLDNVGRRRRLPKPPGPINAIGEPPGTWSPLDAVGDGHEAAPAERGGTAFNQSDRPKVAVDGQMHKMTRKDHS
jgi:succinoglycan biosynthesis transport protein ExoP